MLHSSLKQLVKTILQSPPSEGWSIQGLGMLRLSLAGGFRLQIWHPSLRATGVSDVHSHPWSFRSTVLVGEITNRRYTVMRDTIPQVFCRQEIKCGVGSGVTGEMFGPVEKVGLLPWSIDEITEGHSYEQHADEIHRTTFSPGTVTLLERHMHKSMLKPSAAVFWAASETWVSAAPRTVFPYEVQHIFDAALRRLN